MVSAISYFLPALCLRINSSRSMGMARFQISSQDIFVNCSLVRRLSATDFFIAMIGLRFYLGVFGSYSFVQLPSFSGIQLCRMIRWVRKFALAQSNQFLLFRLHQYLLMSSSFGMPACNNSISKLAFLDTLYAKWRNFVCLIYPIAYEKTGVHYS